MAAYLLIAPQFYFWLFGSKRRLFRLQIFSRAAASTAHSYIRRDCERTRGPI